MLILMKKNNHQNQDIAKSWKKQFFNYFLIRISMRKSNHQNQDIAKSWKKTLFQLIFFKLEFQLEKATTKTKILPKAGETNFSIIFYFEL